MPQTTFPAYPARPKNRSKLIATFGSIESILENTDPSKEAERKPREFKEQALLKELVTIHCDVPIGVAPTELIPAKFNMKLLKNYHKT